MTPNTVMFEIMRNQWIILAIMGGISLTIAFTLTYWALWRPREEERREGGKEISGLAPFFKWVISFTPWVLVLAVVSTMAYVAVHLLTAALQPPNW